MTHNALRHLTLRPWVRDLSPFWWVASQELVLTSLPRASFAAWPPAPPPPLQPWAIGTVSQSCYHWSLTKLLSIAALLLAHLLGTKNSR